MIRLRQKDEILPPIQSLFVSRLSPVDGPAGPADFAKPNWSPGRLPVGQFVANYADALFSFLGEW